MVRFCPHPVQHLVAVRSIRVMGTDILLAPVNFANNLCSGSGNYAEAVFFFLGLPVALLHCTFFQYILHRLVPLSVV